MADEISKQLNQMSSATWLKEFDSLAISCPLEILESVPPPAPMSIAALASWIPIPLDIDNLTVKIDELNFTLQVSKDHHSRTFVYSGTPRLMSRSPFEIIHSVVRVLNPSIKTQGKGWNSICYQGHTLIWWRRQYLISHVSWAIHKMFPSIDGVEITTSSQPRNDTSFPSANNRSPKLITFTAQVSTDIAKDEIGKIYPELKVTVISQQLKLEYGFVYSDSKISNQ